MKRIVLFAMLMAVALSATANHWAPNPGSYDNTATMIGVIQIDGVEQSLTTLEVGAFCGDECRGSAMPILVSQLNRCLLFMTLYGNDGDVLDFRLYDHTLGQESDLVCTSTLTFASNATYGSGASPYVLNFEAIPFYNVTATANPRAGGSVTGAGSFMEGLTCTLTATPAKGYSFVDWTEDGATVATTTDYTFTVTSDRRLVANFSPHQYEIAATAQPVAGGTVEGAGTYSHDATATLTATPATGYSFTGWSENGQKVSTNTTYTFRVTGTRSLVANFSLNSYYIVVLTDPMEGGTVTGVGLYDHGATATLTATAAASYSFINWTENGEVVSTEATYSFTVTEERTLTAHFGLSSYEIAATANPSEGGTVNGAGTYTHGTSATLSAAAATGYVFGNWTENGVTVSTDPNYTFTVTAPRSLTANFVFQGLGGHWTPDPSMYAGTATMIGVLQIDGVEQATSTLEVGAFSDDQCRGSAVPVYVPQANRYLLFMSLYGDEGDVLGFRLYDHDLDQESELVCASTVTFAENATFGSGASPYVLNFEDIILSHSITATANPAEYGTVTGAGTYNHGTTATLTATPATGYSFVNWTEDGEEFSSEPAYLFTVLRDRSLVANFILSSYEITATANPSGSGTIAGTGTYNHGAMATLTAEAATGYTFVNWTEDGEEVSTESAYLFTVTGARSLVANYSPNDYEITVVGHPTEGGSVTGAGTYTFGTTATLTATAVAGYSFANWTENGEVVSTDSEYSFTVTGARELVANFNPDTHFIVAMVDPVEGGTVTGVNAYGYGSTATLVATAASGYTFARWTENGEAVCTDATYSFTVTGDRTLTAHFIPTGAGNYWTTTPSSYASTATLLGVIQINGVEQASATLEVGAFCDEECRGSGMPVYVPQLDRYLLFMTLYGNDDDMLSFRLYDHALSQESDLFCPSTVSFAANATFGSGESPYILNFLESFVINASANPTEGGMVDGAGTYYFGTSSELTATANEGYAFVNWTEDGEEVSTDLTYVFTVPGERSLVANFSLNSYEITAEVNPTEGGTVTGTGTYSHFDECTLTATPNEGYTFVNWTEDGEEVSTDLTYVFTVTGERSLVANFSLNSYEITAEVNPTEGGTVTGTGTYNHFDECTLTATPNEGYTFVNWTEDGEEVSTDLTYVFTVTGERSLTANFSLNSYEITAEVNPTEGGTVTGTGTYNHFDECSLTATASEGYTFVNWTEDGEEVSTDLTYVFTVTGERSLVANFSLNSYEITAEVNPTEGGTVTGTGTYNHFDECTLTATANEGYTFVNWTEDGEEVSTDLTYVFTVTGERSLVANFSLNSYEITAEVNPTEGGTVTGTGTYNHFDECSLTATANEGYTFVNWTEDGVGVSTDLTYVFTVTGGRSLVANFSLNSYEITAEVNPTEGGTVTGTGTYNHFDECELTATPNEGYTFVNWTEDGEEVSTDLTDLTYVFTVTGERSLVANFSLNSYEITAEANPAEGGTVTGIGTYNHFDECTLTATANEGYTFVNWTEDGEEVSTNLTDLTYVFTVTGERSLVANFSLNSYEITAEVNPTEGGTVTGTGTYSHFDECSLTATANEGYTFVNWTEDGEEVSTDLTDLTYVFTVTGERSLVANFSLNSYEIIAEVNPAEGGTVTGTGTYNHFDECTLTATPNEGYTFVNWTEDGEEVSTDLTYVFTVTGECSLVANFSLNSYEITAEVNPTEGGTVTGTGTYSHFDECSLTAIANEGYTFVNWTENGEEVSTDLTYLFTVTEERSLVANFSLNSYEITTEVNPTEGGTVTGTGTYNHFDECTLTATANEGYTFVNWTENGEEVSTDLTYLFTVTEERSLVANFSLNSYEITAEVNPVEGGTVTGTGTYNHFDECELTATANEGYTFVNWTEDGEEVSTDLTYVFTVTGERSLVANFSLNSYEITAEVNPTEGGTVTGTGTYNHFDECSLTATANEGYTFVNWTEDGEEVSTDLTYLFTVTGERSLTANFSLNSYEITAEVNPTEGGIVTGTGTYNHFDECELTATANEGYTFVNWTEDGEEVSTDLTYVFTVTGERSLTANFSLNSYEITAEVNPTEGGTVTGTGTYNHFDECELTATANEGYTFVNWTEDGEEVSTDLTYLFTVTGERSLVANFSLNSYEITAEVNPTEGGTVTGTGTYNHFDECTLTATPNEGYAFVNWTEDGEEVSTDLTYLFTVTGERSLTANFSLNSYEITAEVNPTEGGIVTGTGTYSHFDECELTATANEGYTFVNWTEDGEEVSTDLTYVFTVTGERSLVANFSLNSYEITAEANPAEGGTVTGTGTYNHFDECTLTATPNEGYAFVNWTEDGEEVSTDLTYVFTVTGERSLVANFAVSQDESVEIVLSPGWNWISYLPTTEMTVEAAFANLSPNDGDMVKTQDAFCTYNASTGQWSGRLNTFTPGRGLIYLRNGEMTSFSYPSSRNNVATPDPERGDVVIALTPGWNWISYLPTTEMTVESAFANLSPNDGDMVKTQDAFCTYNASTGQWSGGLNTFSPGRGLIYLRNGGTTTFTYPK